jgi:MoaA/NifB/PqqE/SkfB family radical SAM enzyme
MPLARVAKDWGVAMNYSPYTWLRTNDMSYMMAKKDLPELREVFRKLLAFKKRHGTVALNATFLNNIVAFFDQGGIGTCRSGERFLNVNPDGTFSPCGLFTRAYRTRAELQNGFSKNNSCSACNTSIRAWTERPFATLFSNLGTSEVNG